MKKIIFATAAAMVMFSACETLVSHEGEISPDVNSEKIILTATLDAQTKTYLEQVNTSTFKTRWGENDDFIVLDRDVDLSTIYGQDGYTGWFELVSGAGESTAVFELEEGVLPNRYYALYGEYDIIEGTNNIVLWLPRWQDRELYESKDGETIQGFDDWTYPMFAVGEGTNVSFKNLCSVLKLNVTGNGEELQYVKVETLDEGVYLSGTTKLNLSTSRPTLEFLTEDVGDYEMESSNFIYFDPETYDENNENTIPAVLSNDPVECYIVIPAQRYPSGLKITLITNEGIMEVTTSTDLNFEVSELREVPALRYESEVTYEGCWNLISDENPIPAMFSEEGDYMVIKNLFINEYAYIYLYDEYNNEYGWTNEYADFYQITNTCGQLESDGHHIVIRQEGYYDIYLNPQTLQLYIMSAGVSLSDIPTMDEVTGHDYQYFLDRMEYNDLVKVYGYVAAVSQRGFILKSHNRYEPIFVYTYDAPNLSVDMKTMLNNVQVGDAVELYAVTETFYEGMPELSDVRWCKVYDDDYEDGYYATDITNLSEVFYSTYAEHIRYVGVLNISGTYYNVTIDGNDNFKGSIYWPLEDLTQYNGRKVVVEGFYLGTSGTSVKYVNTMLTRIAVPDITGSTEDVIPDDDLVGTEVIQTK